MLFIDDAVYVDDSERDELREATIDVAAAVRTAPVMEEVIRLWLQDSRQISAHAYWDDSAWRFCCDAFDCWIYVVGENEGQLGGLQRVFEIGPVEGEDIQETMITQGVD